MPIPESQLKTWSLQGSITQSSNTYNIIKNVLEGVSTPYAGKNFRVFLQGSYGNATNIYAESDVDIIICLDDCFYYNLEALSEQEKAACMQVFSGANYDFKLFKQDVLEVLHTCYGSAVHEGTKAITIDGNSSRRKADVIVSCQYRRYLSFCSYKGFKYEEGICFFNSSRELIANYPRQHSANLTNQHQISSSCLKPIVRIFKNIRSRLVAEGKIKMGVAPSYYIEGLLYNVPSSTLVRSYQHYCIENILNWYCYLQETEKKNLVCANEQYYLLREGHQVCWTPADCDTFVNAAIKLWNEW